jgi:hypothetical protein
VRTTLTLDDDLLAAAQRLLGLIEHDVLYGMGIGCVDAQLLVATKLTPDATLWTRDKRLTAVATPLGLSFQPTSHPRSREVD